jgi:hypothetical protein
VRAREREGKQNSNDIAAKYLVAVKLQDLCASGKKNYIYPMLNALIYSKRTSADSRVKGPTRFAKTKLPAAF